MTVSGAVRTPSTSTVAEPSWVRSQPLPFHEYDTEEFGYETLTPLVATGLFGLGVPGLRTVKMTGGVPPADDWVRRSESVLYKLRR